MNLEVLKSLDFLREFLWVKHANNLRFDVNLLMDMGKFVYMILNSC